MAARIRVLHVDDDPDFGAVTAELLEDEDDRLRVHTETNAIDALAHVEREAIDCIVTDIEMPGMDGIEFLEEIRNQDERVPVILYTGEGSEAIASEAFSAGATDYLRKGVDAEQHAILANRIRNYAETARIEKQRERQRVAIETAREGISILDSEGYFEYVNEAYANLYGYDTEEMIGRHWELLYPDEEVAYVRDVILPTVADDSYWSGETTGLRADGSTFVEDHAVSATENDQLVCTVRDVTERNQRDQRYQRLVENLPGIVYRGRVRSDWPFEFVHGECNSLTGYSCEQLRSTVNWGEELIHPADRDGVYEAVTSAVERGEPFELTYRIVHPDGDVRWFWERGRQVEADVIEGFITDITAQKRNEERLQKMTGRLEALFEHSPDMIDIHDAEGTILDANARFCETLGYEKADLIGLKVWDVDQRIDRSEAIGIWEELSVGERTRVESEYNRPDGSTFPVEVHLVKIEIDGVLRFIVISRDITDRKAYERQLERENDRLEEFVQVVSHDLRNPLNVAKGRLQLARAECSNEHLDIVDRSHDRMEALIEDLLTVAREGQSVSEFSPVALPNVVDRCWQNVDTATASIEIQTESVVMADGNRLQQLFENLIRNAVEHGGADVTLTVGDIPDEGFYVADDGPGIPAETRETVFESGYSTSDDGTGFGLSIVKRVVEAHGWSVSIVDSERGGARFEITGVTFADT
ncbi:MAG: PAS domain S-box protein [Halobacteriota archaeon]